VARYKYGVGLRHGPSPSQIPRAPKVAARLPTSPPHPAGRLAPRRRRRRDGVRVLHREGPLRLRLPPIRLPGVRASSHLLLLYYPPLSSSLLAAADSRLVSLDLTRRSLNSALYRP
jgi:hypothetical protein